MVFNVKTREGFAGICIHIMPVFRKVTHYLCTPLSQ
jgi:hypothetical protein